jgi:hypothetical protein
MAIEKRRTQKRKQKETKEDSCSLVVMRCAPPETRIKANVTTNPTAKKEGRRTKACNAMLCWASWIDAS